MLTDAACPSCRSRLTGAFCADCGQRAPHPDDFRLRRFAGALTRELTSVDSRALRTLVAIFIPGELTRAYAAREWQRYLPPLRLYLIVSAVFYLLSWDTLSAFSRLVAEQAPAASAAMSDAQRAVMADPALFHAASDYTAWFRFFGVLLMAVWVALWQGPRRIAFGIHLAFATHYYCFDYLFNTLAVMLLRGIGDGSLGLFVVWTSASMFGLLVWATLAIRRVYRRGWPAAIIGGVAILLADIVLSSMAGELANQWVAASVR